MNWNDYRNKILAEIDNEAFFRSELDNIQSRGTEWKASCPFAYLHEGGADANPSFTVNVSKGTYYCNVCHSKGNIHTLYKNLYNMNNEQAWFELGDALNIPRPDSTRPTRPEIDPGLASEYHQALMKLTGPIRQVLSQKRGLTDETIKRFQLGWDGERITIPIYDEYNNLVNFRLYKWNSDNDQYKVTNYVDDFGNAYGEVRIYGIENLVDEDCSTVVWCEGEMDRICAEQHGFPAACPTSGAGSWKAEWTKLFRNKQAVYIAQDNDEAGRNATKKLNERLHSVVDVYNIVWPEDFPVKGDVTDFFTKCGQTSADFAELILGAKLYQGDSTDPRVADESKSVEVTLADSSDAQYKNKRIKVPVMVSGKDTAPYIVPRTVLISCGDAADADSKKCLNCGLMSYAGDYRKVLTAADDCVLKLIKCTDKQQETVIKEIIDVNSTCPRCEITIEDYMNIEEIRMIPKADADFSLNKESDYVVRTGYMITNNIKTNRKYTLAGYLCPEPQTQAASYLFDKAYPDKDIISEFELTEDTLEMLKTLQPKEGQTVKEKFAEIHADLERTVTNVWERSDVAIAADLIYHTATSFYFQEQFVKRGWGELLIIGDSGQAKSTLIERLMQHYRLGEMVSGESSRRTGLIYNLQQNNKRWFLTWGAYPLNDGGLLTVDEMSGLSIEDLALMSDVRSSGIAKVNGVITAETSSRTRAIYISNPRNGKQLNTETYGVEAILKLFGKTEDVRRLDMAMAVASGDVDPTLVNRKISDMAPIKHKYTSDVCNAAVMWAWSRKPDQIKFTDKAVDMILELATEMGRKYNSSIPIVEASDQRLKIARLSIACAARLFSTDNGENVIVDAEHVKFVVDFMNKIYAQKSLGYEAYSKTNNQHSDTSEDNLEALRNKYLILPVMDHNELADVLYQLSYFGRTTLEDYTGMSRDDLKPVYKFLTINRLVERYKQDYRRLPLGTAFLESLKNRPVTKQEVDAARKEHYSKDF